MRDGVSMSALVSTPSFPLAFSAVAPIWDSDSIIGTITVYVESAIDLALVYEQLHDWRN